MMGAQIFVGNPYSRTTIEIHVDRSYTKDQWKSIIEVVESRAEYVNDEWERQQKSKVVVDEDNIPIRSTMTRQDAIERYQEFVSYIENAAANPYSDYLPPGIPFQYSLYPLGVPSQQNHLEDLEDLEDYNEFVGGHLSESPDDGEEDAQLPFDRYEEEDQ